MGFFTDLATAWLGGLSLMALFGKISGMEETAVAGGGVRKLACRGFAVDGAGGAEINAGKKGSVCSNNEPVMASGSKWFVRVMRK